MINPKTMTVNELFGYMTLEGMEGRRALHHHARMSKNDNDLGYRQSQTTKWICLDGDIDTLWIESMNTVMDDNKTPLLSQMSASPTNSMRMVFEMDKKNASPATVSRVCCTSTRQILGGHL